MHIKERTETNKFFQEYHICESVNTTAAKEYKGMQKKKLFQWTHPLRKAADCFVLAHLNIRSLKSHFTNLFRQNILHNLNILCLSETHISSDMDKQRFQVDTHRLSTKIQNIGLAMYVRKINIS